MKTSSPRMTVTAALAFLMLTAVAASTSWGWGDGGHMAVALRAWDALTPAQRSSALALLRQHPRYRQDFQAKMPPGLSPEEQDLWLFAYAATWPDYVWKIRIPAPADFHKYFHGAWHVIGQQTALDPQAQDTMPVMPQPTTQDLNRMTVRDALPLVTADLNNPDLPAADRAVALCWVMHLTGDLHEPCHTASLVCKRFPAPDGDHVATKFSVVVAGHSVVMHSFWDSLYCNSTDLEVLKAWEHDVAADLTLQREALPELTRDTTVASWVAESFAIARQSVYDADVRAAIASQDAAPDVAFVPIVLSDDYVHRAREIGRRRGVLAGFRLADTLARVPW